MIHRTFRSLDQTPRLLAFTIKQWALLIGSSAALLGLIHVSHLSMKPAITVFVVLIGLPAALTYVSESGGLQLGVLLRDMWRWRFSRHALPPASAERPRACGLLVLESTQEPSRRAQRAQENPALTELLTEERWG